MRNSYAGKGELESLHLSSHFPSCSKSSNDELHLPISSRAETLGLRTTRTWDGASRSNSTSAPLSAKTIIFGARPPLRHPPPHEVLRPVAPPKRRPPRSQLRHLVILHQPAAEGEKRAIPPRGGSFSRDRRTRPRRPRSLPTAPPVASPVPSSRARRMARSGRTLHDLRGTEPAGDHRRGPALPVV